MAETKWEWIYGHPGLGTPVGSRRVAWQLLAEYGLSMAVSMAPRALCRNLLSKAGVI